MGSFYQSFSLAAKTGARFAEVTAMVDTGSVYTLLPAPALSALGVAPEWRSRFELADGSEPEYDLARSPYPP